jgi:hypothetical protein
LVAETPVVAPRELAPSPELSGPAPKPDGLPESTAELVPAVVHVATQSGVPALENGVLQQWWGVVNSHFAQAGIGFAPEVRMLPEGFAALTRVRDRRALKRFLVPHRVNVFLVGTMLDPVASESTKRAAGWQGLTLNGRLAGAHIEAEGKLPGTYIVVSAQDGSAIALTHELGHFFGLSHHRDGTNIMSYGAKREHFDDAQLETMRRTLRALLRRHVL